MVFEKVILNFFYIQNELLKFKLALVKKSLKKDFMEKIRGNYGFGLGSFPCAKSFNTVIYLPFLSTVQKPEGSLLSGAEA